MTHSQSSFFRQEISLLLVSLIFFLASRLAFPLTEILGPYNSSACLAQGNACTSTISGFAAHFYNPAGLARFKKKDTEFHLVVAETQFNAHSLGILGEEKSVGLSHWVPNFEKQPGNYQFFNLTSFPSITFRNFSFGILANYQIAGLPSSTHLDIDARQDLIPTIGFSRHFAGNLLRLGVSAKAYYRNQMKGTYSFSQLNSISPEDWGTLHREGLGLGMDSGLLLTFPHQFLPTLGFSWLNMFNTKFEETKILNFKSSGKPEQIAQSFNLGFSLSPFLGNGWKYRIAADYRHLEKQNASWKKSLHLGLEFEKNRTLFFWAGFNQLYPTGGIGLRAHGGHLEIGTYAQEVGSEGQWQEDRRYFFRFTVSF